MYRPASPSQAGQLDVLDWWRNGIKSVIGLLIVFNALAVHAQLPRQTQPPPMFIPHEQSDNTFLASAILPPDLRRVAVLPLAWEGSQIDLAQGAETLVPILLTELDKTKKFEVVSISREDLRSQTGRLSWTGAEILPTDFFDSLQRVYGCDAVLFSQLTTFRAYAPMVVGWRMKLVEAQTGKILWAVDKVFDAGQQPAVNQTPRPLAALWPFHDDTDDWRAENSPRQFGQFTIAQALSTLPNRKEMAKVSAPATDVPSGRQSDKKLSPLKKNYGN